MSRGRGRGRSGSQGIVNLQRVRRHDGRRDDCSESDRRILGDFGEFEPMRLITAHSLVQRTAIAAMVLYRWRDARD
jgi:hypothetical protein